MAVSTIPKEQGIWQSGVIASETYGTLYGHYNTALKIAFLSWNGNSTAPTAGQKSFTMPSVYTPRQNSSVPVRMGDNMEVRTDGSVRITLTTSTWSGAAIMYPLA